MNKKSKKTKMTENNSITGKKKIPLQVYFDTDDYERLRRYAFENHLKMAEAVRSWSLDGLERKGY